MIKKNILLVILLTLFSISSCYNGLLDTYENRVQYKLYDRGPAGGIIFYINPNYMADGWRYLEAAASDQSADTAWSSVNTAIGSSAQGQSIGTGKTNTDAIIQTYGSNALAANICRNYRGGGYSDWFLPSIIESREMYSRKDGISGLDSGTYWSSSEYNTTPTQAIYKNFNSSGNEQGISKTSTGFLVRAIRAF